MSVSANITNKRRQTIIELVLTADEDTYEIDLGNASQLGLDSQNSITSDELEIYFSADPTPTYTEFESGVTAFEEGEYSKYIDNSGAAPFSATNDNISNLSIIGQKKMLVRRKGGLDSDLKIIINMSK